MYGQPPPYAMNQMMSPQPMMNPMMNQGMINQGMMTPPPPMYPSMSQGATIINVSKSSGTKCPFCNENTGNILRRKAGCVTWAWCVCLMFTTGCCFIPFCVDGCKDIEQVCERCSNVKNITPANCC